MYFLSFGSYVRNFLVLMVSCPGVILAVAFELPAEVPPCPG